MMITALLNLLFPGRKARLISHLEKIYSDAIAKRNELRRHHKAGVREQQKIAQTALARIMELEASQ